MKLKRTPILTIAVMTVLGIGVVAVQASPTCQRIVREYREKVLPKHFSNATLARWAEWGKAHPNYHPKPKPRPALGPQETLSKVQFDCEVPLLQQDVAILLPPVLPDANTMAELELPVFASPVAPTVSLVGVPTVVPPILTGGDVPEPSSFVLLASGLGLLLLFRRAKGRNNIASAAVTIR